MGKLYDELAKDIRFEEGLKACMNCGICTAICPAAEFYNYDPRLVIDAIQRKNDSEIEELLRTDTIWYCGECMSCKTRCPRGNVPGLVIMALRRLSQKMGYFTDSEKGRQQFILKRTVGHSMLYRGYCVYPDTVSPDLHPEQGPVWDWIYNNTQAIMDKLGASYKKEGAGTLRNTSDNSLEDIKNIFDITGGTEMFDTIEKFSKQKADELDLEFDDSNLNEYFYKVYTENNGKHS